MKNRISSKNMLQKLSFLGIIACIIFIASCKKVPLWNKDYMFSYVEAQDGVFVYDCSDYTLWHFFSFKDAGIIGSCDAMDSVAIEEWRNRTDWDLAFHRQNVKSNSGLSGVGNGGILEYVQEEFDFDVVTEAPTDGYSVDVADSVVYDMSQMMMGYIDYAHTGVNPVTKEWAVLTDMMSGLWTYAQKVFVVRTADEKYAKIYLMNFKSDIGASGTVTMKYVYQSDGTVNLNTTN